jgi:uncharacterized protein (TIGR02147 family)
MELNLLEACPVRGLRKTVSYLFIDSHSEPEIRQFQKKMIDKSVTALEHNSVKEMEELLINSITFPISHKTIPEIREEIMNFQRKILKIIRNNDYEEVYQLNCQLFPLTKITKGSA